MQIGFCDTANFRIGGRVYDGDVFIVNRMVCFDNSS